MGVIPDVHLHALEDVATRLRIHSIRATTAAGSGHASSSASAADLVAAIFFDAMRFDPREPRAPRGDRFVLSKGHAAPLLYAAWAEAGFLKPQDLLTLRQLDSDLEGHPTPRLPFVDVATGSLGQGLSVGVGLALGARLEGIDQRVYVLLGDGEMAEGSVWEAAQMAGHLHLDTLIGVVDVNRQGQTGPTMLGHDLRAYQRRFAAAGWRVFVIDGHEMREVVQALRRARRAGGAPTAIVARTLKGKGIEALEDAPGSHGKALPKDAAERAVAALESRLRGVPPPKILASRMRRGTRGATAPAASVTVPELPDVGTSAATREAYGDSLVRLGARDPRVVVLDADVSNSTFAERFRFAFPDRYVEAYIAEQNMVGVAAGLAARGHVAFASSFGCFLSRAFDQIRMAGISRSNVKLSGSHAGVSIGEDGPSQMALEDLAMFRAIPECVIFYPSDAVCTDACLRLAAQHRGMVYIRTTRPQMPVLYPRDEVFAVGGLKVLQASNRDRLTIVAAGITLHEALAAHAELASAGVAVRVIDLYCVKPVDGEALRRAATETDKALLTVEDHYSEGGLGDAVLDAVSPGSIAVHKLAVREIPRSGPARKLLERYGIDRRRIVARVREILGG